MHSSSLKLYKLHIPTTQLVERSTYIAQKAIWINERAVLFCKCKYCFSIAKYHQHPFIIPMALSSRYWLRNISLIDVSWKFTSTLYIYICIYISIRIILLDMNYFHFSYLIILYILINIKYCDLSSWKMAINNTFAYP